MKNTFFLVVILCTVLLSVSCSDDKGEEEKLVTPVIEVGNESTNVTLPETSTGTATVSFTCNTAWQIITDDGTRAAPSWFDVSPKKGGAGTHTLTVTIKEENTEYSDRGGLIKIVSGDVQKYITVTQKKKEALLITQSRYEVDINGGEIEVEVKANVEFKVDIKNPEWIRRVEARALTMSKLRFTVSAFEETEPREGQIVFSSGNLSETVTVYQAGGEILVLTQNEYTVPASGETIRLEIRSNTEYTVEMPDVNWIKQSTTRAVSVYTKHCEIIPNQTYGSRTAIIVVRTATKREEVVVTQLQKDAIILAESEYGFDLNGGTLAFDVQHNIDFDVAIEESAKNWITQITTRSLQTKTLNFQIAEHTGDDERSGQIILSKGELKQVVTVIQTGTAAEVDPNYTSTDYSDDGKVLTLQRATEGNGIDIVLMGDAFTDRLIADGTYERMMRKGMEAFFSEEPYRSYRNMFNVYAVCAVSANEIYDDYSITALEGYFGEGTLIVGNDQKCFDYALNAVSDDRMDDALIIVIMNSENYGGTCYMYTKLDGDYGRGASISYFPIGEDDETFEGLILHEAGGHGFAKLADEYSYQSQGAMPDNEIAGHKSLGVYGWWKNGDFTNDPTQVKWAKFLEDARYAQEGLGIYEGAFTYWTRAYRPTQYSIMHYNWGGFNAPSREAIYYRINKLAYGAEWAYSYEDFVSYDARNRTAAALAARREQANKAATRAGTLKRQAPPVVYRYSWREAK